MAKAAILEQPGNGLTIGDIEIADPMPHEVLIDKRHRQITPMNTMTLPMKPR